MLTAGVVIVLLVVYAFMAIYSSHQSYDDEGFMMIMESSLSRGLIPYRETFLQYGPAFVAWSSFLHETLHVPLTHDAVRALTLLGWLLGAATSGALTWRVTQAAGLAAVVAVLSFFVLEVVVKEPGHPQLLGFTSSVLALLFLHEGRSAGPSGRGRLYTALAGFLIAVVACVKINLGLYVALAVMLPAAARSVGARRPGPAPAHLLLLLILVFCVLLPFLLLRESAFTAFGFFHGAQVWLAVALVVQAGRAVPDNGHEKGHQQGHEQGHEEGHEEGQGQGRAQAHEVPAADLQWAALAVGGLVALGVCLSAALLRGASLVDVVEGAVLAPSRYVRLVTPGVVASITWWECLSPIAAAGGAVLLRRRSPGALRSLRLVFSLSLFLVVVLHVVTEAPASLAGGTDTRGGVRLLLLCHASAVGLLVDRRPMARELGLFAALSTLVAVPIGGSQVAFAALPLLWCAALAWREVASSAGFEAWRGRGVALVAGVAAVASCTSFALGRYADGAPLDLPGSRLLRLPPTQAAHVRAIATRVQERCDAMLTLPGRWSFSFWSGVPPASGWNATLWTALLNDDQQTAMMDALDRAERPCVLIATAHPIYVPPGSSPAIRRIESDYRDEEDLGGYLLLRQSAPRP